MVARFLCLAMLIGCGGKYGGTPKPTTPTGKQKGGIENAALPYSVLDRTGHQVEPAAFWAQVGAARIEGSMMHAVRRAAKSVVIVSGVTQAP